MSLLTRLARLGRGWFLVRGRGRDARALSGEELERELDEALARREALLRRATEAADEALRPRADAAPPDGAAPTGGEPEPEGGGKVQRNPDGSIKKRL